MKLTVLDTCTVTNGDISLRELEERGARAGVIWQDGAAFAWPDSIRMNLALPHSRLVEAMEHLRVHAFC